MTSFNASILLQGFEVLASIGAHDFEKTAPQRFLIDVKLDLRDPARPDKDRIDGVLDYDFLRTEIRKLLQGRHYELQETFCFDVASICLQRRGVKSVTVYARKPDVYPDCESVGFCLSASHG